MRINTNLNAMTALNQASKNTALAGTSMNKLSSGERINKAGDDAAGMAISEKMRGQIRGLDQASKNAQDGISVVQTAEGAMEEISNITQRMRELSVQAANETNGVEDREKITTELKQLHSEIDRIAESTQFNGKKLLASGTSGEMEITGVSGAGETTGDGASAITITSGFKDLDLNGKDITVTTDAFDAGNESAVTVKIGDVEYKGTIADDDKTITIDDEKGNKMQVVIKTALTASQTDLKVGRLDVEVTNKDLTVKGDSIKEVKDVKGFTDEKFKNATMEVVKNGTEYTFKIVDENGKTLAKSGAVTDLTAKIDFNDEDGNAMPNHSMTLGIDKTKLDAEITLNGSAKLDIDTFRDDLTLDLQIGANTGKSEGLKVNISNGSTKSLGLEKTDIENINHSSIEEGTKAARNLVDKLDEALRTVNTSRANLGATQNRLETAQSNLTTSSENLTAAESRIRDVDVAKEMMNLSKLNLLNQASQAMMSQAKSQPEGVMQLLR